jgi:putative FmdB family regulatory protein
MPTYEYACRSCGQHLEVVQSFKDDPLTECPSCAGDLRKVFSAAGIIFKGSGWHVKDYAGSAKGGSAAASSSKDADGASTGSSSGSSSSDSSSGSSSSSEGRSSTSSSSSGGADAKSA